MSYMLTGAVCILLCFMAAPAWVSSWREDEFDRVDDDEGN